MGYALDQLGGYLEEIQQHSTLVRRKVTPAPGSQAAREKDGCSPEVWAFIRQGVLLANTRLVVAEEHLATLGKLVRDTRSVYSVYTVARTAAEISALAWWLLDPEISVAERAGRGVGQRLYSIQQQGELPVENAKADAKKRRREVLAQADRAGVTPVYVKSATNLVGRIHATGMPQDKEADKLQRLGKVQYKLHSAFTHGTTYALQHLMQPATPEERERMADMVDGDADTTLMRVGTEASSEVVAVMGALLPYWAAAKSFMAYTGRHSQRWLSYVTYTIGEARQHLPDRAEP